MSTLELKIKTEINKLYHQIEHCCDKSIVSVELSLFHTTLYEVILDLFKKIQGRIIGGESSLILEITNSQLFAQKSIESIVNLY